MIRKISYLIQLDQAYAKNALITKNKLNENAAYLAQKRHQHSCKEEEMGKIDYHYEQFRSWADEFDSASPERKK